MGLLSRRRERRAAAATPPVPPLAPAVKASLRLRRGEKILAHAVDAAGERVYVATASAMVVAPARASADAPEVGRVPWYTVQDAGWDSDTGVLSLTQWSDDTEREPMTRRIRFDAATLFLAVLRERVTSTVVLTREVVIAGTDERVARVSVRRRPEDDAMFVQLDRFPGIDHDRPDVEEAVARAVAVATSDVGR